MPQNIEPKFLRKEHMILNPDRSVFQQMDSIAKAKRWSREFQQQNGGIGCGVVAVIATEAPKNFVMCANSPSLERDSSFARQRRQAIKREARDGWRKKSFVHTDERVGEFQRLRKKKHGALP